MPVNPLYILIPLFLVWGAIAYYLSRWKLRAAGVFIVLSAALLIVHYMNTGVERKIEEQMQFRLVEMGDYRTVEFTSQHGDKITWGSPALVEHLRGLSNNSVQVVMTGTYDYNHLRAYEVHSVDGIKP